jgi:hypothetical protein
LGDGLPGDTDRFGQFTLRQTGGNSNCPALIWRGQFPTKVQARANSLSDCDCHVTTLTDPATKSNHVVQPGDKTRLNEVAIARCHHVCDAHPVTSADDEGPGILLPGTQVRLSLDISETADPNRFTFAARPAVGEAERAWRIEGDVIRTAQGLKITSITVDTDPDSPAEITGTLMRQIPIGTILDYVRGRVSATLAEDLPDVPQKVQAVPAGRTALTDAFLRDVAISYLRETAPGKPRGATRRLAETYGRPEETIRTWISRSRKAGWLGPSAKGRSGAERGPRLRDLTSEEYTRLYSAETTLEDQARMLAGIKGVSLEEARRAVQQLAGESPRP